MSNSFSGRKRSMSFRPVGGYKPPAASANPGAPSGGPASPQPQPASPASAPEPRPTQAEREPRQSNRPIREPEAREVEGDAAQTASGQLGKHLAVQERRCGDPVQADDGLPVPLVAHEAGALAVGRAPAAIDANAVGKAAAVVAPFHSDLHASATYKQELVQTLACRAIAQALAGSNMA